MARSNQEPAVTVTTPVASPSVVYVKSPDKFPTGAVIGLAVFGGIVALIYVYREDIWNAIKPPATEKWCEKEGKNIPISQWTETRCGTGSNGGNGEFKGVVYGNAGDYRGAPLSGVNVTLQDSNQKDISTTITDEKGNYQFKDVAAGGYYVKFSKTCYDSSKSSYIDLSEQRPTGLASTNLTRTGDIAVQFNAYDSKQNHKIDILPIGCDRKCKNISITLTGTDGCAGNLFNSYEFDIYGYDSLGNEWKIGDGWGINGTPYQNSYNIGKNLRGIRIEGRSHVCAAPWEYHVPWIRNINGAASFE